MQIHRRRRRTHLRQLNQRLPAQFQKVRLLTADLPVCSATAARVQRVFRRCSRLWREEPHLAERTVAYPANGGYKPGLQLFPEKLAM